MEITHRILKPSNIMIETNGLDIIVKLASFTCIENDSELYRVDLSEPFCLAPEGFKRRFD